jgi:prepilin-type N-terminal cleavage/methylation domain-containing protein
MQRPRILRNNKGFTLVEAMVVIVIIAVMAGFSYSGFTARQKREQLRSAAMLLMEYLREDKMFAIEKSIPCDITFNGNIYTTFIDENGDSVYTAGTDTLLHQVNLASEYPGVTFNPAVTSVLAFNSKGMPSLTAGTFPCDFTLQETYRGSIFTCKVRVSSVGMIDVVRCLPADGPNCMDLTYK